ncbi:sigma-70 family RNA polymerase sigma factor [Miniimonas arenae]|uniref:Sigma-70 family RNA polymerase sigma factor n=1 Tax=Miniimonas arenae TaxID=676201 RepID=A0A5C5BI93_9MICO|nr:sigma-70 family RNA polymerase sigma factor [Miniimonas arenae]
MLLDERAVRRPDVRAIHDGYARRVHGTVGVEPDGQGRAGVRIGEWKRVEHVSGGGDAAVDDASRHGEDGHPHDVVLTNPGVAGTREAVRRDFEQFARSVSAELLRFIASRLGAQAAEDVLAETLLVLWRRWADVPDGVEARRRWVYGIAKNMVRRHEHEQALSRNRLAVLTSERPAPGAPADTLVVATLWAEDLVESLPGDEQQVVRLVAIDGLSMSEVSDRLGVSPSAIGSRLYRARRRLRRLIESEGGDR